MQKHQTDLGLKCDEKDCVTSKPRRTDAHVHTCTKHFESRQLRDSICNQVEKQKWRQRLSPPPQKLWTAFSFHLIDCVVPMRLIKIGSSTYIPFHDDSKFLKYKVLQLYCSIAKWHVQTNQEFPHISPFLLMRRSSWFLADEMALVSFTGVPTEPLRPVVRAAWTTSKHLRLSPGRRSRKKAKEKWTQEEQKVQ